MTKLIVLALVIVALAIAPVVANAGITYNVTGSAKQIFMPASDFSNRSMNRVGGGPDFVNDDATANAGALSGNAYHFPGDPGTTPGAGVFGPAVTLDWWVEYTIPLSALPAGFITAGSTWGFTDRVTQSAAAATSIDSDWLVMKGDPEDSAYNSPFSPVVNPGPMEASSGQPIMRVNNNPSIDGGLFNYKYGWWSESWGAAGVPAGQPDVIRTRVFNPDNGSITFRIYKREADPYNALIDTICWTTDTNITELPTDADFLASKTVPEPASLLALLAGIPALSLFARRRRS